MAPTFLQVFFGLVAALYATSAVSAESHTVKFNNQCGKGTPQLIVGGKVVSTGQDYTTNGPLVGGIAYLQTGNCLFNGEGCTLLEMTLGNAMCPGCGSSSDISLITPHAFNVEASISYFGGSGGCNSVSTTCSSENCNTAFHQPNDNQVQIQCEEDNVGLLITFCGSGGAPPASSSAHSSPAAPAKTSVNLVATPSAPAETPSPAKPSPSPVSSSASAASASPSVNRASCKNKRTLQARGETATAARRRSNQEARELYNLHERRQRAQSRAHARRSN